MKFILDFLWILTHPNYWIMNYPYCPHWDKILNDLIDRGIVFTQIGQFDAKIGKFTVWIENYPYACMTVHNLRPSRRTIHRAWQHLNACRFL